MEYVICVGGILLFFDHLGEDTNIYQTPPPPDPHFFSILWCFLPFFGGPRNFLIENKIKKKLHFITPYYSSPVI